MYKIIKHILFWVLLLSCSFSYSQITGKVGETTTLSVTPVVGETYVWQLYDSSVDFVQVATGNCPPSKAVFVGSTTNSQVQINWLQSGEYFYKVTASNSCTDNVKIGKIKVLSAMLSPTINVAYDCLNNTAVLTVQNYTGTLLWSTGETTPFITVSQDNNTYWVEETKGTEKAKVEVKILKKPISPRLTESVIKIQKGSGVTLSAICNTGNLKWYTDAGLTQELTNNYVTPWVTTNYYAVCQENVGCPSSLVKVIVEVEDKDKCILLYNNMSIPNAVSSNVDGINDTWELDDLGKYCKECGSKNKVIIFNRWGVKVYEKENYMLDSQRFEGYSKHKRTVGKYQQLPQGTYYYIIEIENKPTKTGFIYLKGAK